ncbi:MAG: apolipoprotein N-acyltransferase [Nocardioidaceae bacterium]
MPAPRTSRLLLRSGAAALGGIGVGCGFAPVESLALLWAGLTLFVLALRGSSLRAGALLGALFGATFMTMLVWWVHVLGSGVLLALVAASVPFYVLFAMAFTRIALLRAWPVWGALLWMAFEYLRSIVPFGGFPWGRLAFATVGTPLAPYSRWVGVAAVSGLVFGLAALTAYVLERRRARTVAVAIPAAVAILGVGALLPTGLASPGDRIEVAVIQGNVPGTGADGMGQQRQVLHNHVRATLEYASQVDAGERPAPDAVLWPENASDIDPIAHPEAGAQISAAARAVGAPILVGAILNGPTPDTAENAGIAWSPDTGPGERYVKRHLVPFGEYVPFGEFSRTLVPRLDREIPRDMVPGTKPGVLDLGPVTVGDMMCFDVVFDRLARDAVLGGAQMLVVQTNNATYLGTSQPDQQWQIARMRAIESGHVVAVPSTNGVSGFVDGDGQVLAKSQSGRAAILAERVTEANGVTWGIRIGVWVEYAATAAALCGLLLGLRRRRRTRPVTTESSDADAVRVEAVRA